MNRKVLLLVVAAALMWSCGENPLEPNVPGPNEIWFQSGEVVPKNLTVSKGTTVTWINKDSESHAVDSGTFMNPTGDFPASPNLSRNQRYSHTFNKGGTFPYYCVRHQTRQSEQGSIVVR